ncbi:hypothetical protein N658DRAFT_26266 [Parathielavia hyrcaniae]|uniref:Uncharacterized protein n=1 Tax=Parathielavia hyrcaniae TaxID=113614 RepID=A0AAN6QBS5_9PEZI|nr:hypothetical protein N658DRAFT_26266 [Parathielavia hyrcaniae]
MELSCDSKKAFSLSVFGPQSFWCELASFISVCIHVLTYTTSSRPVIRTVLRKSTLHWKESAQKLFTWPRYSKASTRKTQSNQVVQCQDRAVPCGTTTTKQHAASLRPAASIGIAEVIHEASEKNPPDQVIPRAGRLSRRPSRAGLDWTMPECLLFLWSLHHLSPLSTLPTTAARLGLLLQPRVLGHRSGQTDHVGLACPSPGLSSALDGRRQDLVSWRKRQTTFGWQTRLDFQETTSHVGAVGCQSIGPEGQRLWTDVTVEEADDQSPAFEPKLVKQGPVQKKKKHGNN